ncbi:MAG: ACP S-malonyltransferase [Tatlockia sp.]|jgi:[acyl-carrier-protein] S-malonyltransferase
MNKLAFVFPGQGSQSVGMLSSLAEDHGSIKDDFARVSARLGYDLWHLVQEGPESKLNQTEYTQAAMLTADVALFNLLYQMGFKPRAAFMAGHSLGEYAALVCANALSLEEAAILVTKRGQLMQHYVPLGQGAMAAIVGLTDEEVSSLCSQISTKDASVSPANFNAPGQVVIAGHLLAVEEAVRMAEAHNARLAKIIPVSVPCHCPLLMDAAEAFADALQEAPFKMPEVAVISNVDLSVYQSIDAMRKVLKQQLYSPVRWVETIQLMKNQGVESVIECGPGKVLNGLVKRIERSLSILSVNDPFSFEQALRINV